MRCLNGWNTFTTDARRCFRSEQLGNAAHGLAFGKDQVLFNQVVQGQKFVFIQVILGNHYVLFAHFRAPPGGQAHIGLVAEAARHLLPETIEREAAFLDQFFILGAVGKLFHFGQVVQHFLLGRSQYTVQPPQNGHRQNDFAVVRLSIVTT